MVCCYPNISIKCGLLYNIKELLEHVYNNTATIAVPDSIQILGNVCSALVWNSLRILKCLATSLLLRSSYRRTIELIICLTLSIHQNINSGETKNISHKCIVEKDLNIFILWGYFFMDAIQWVNWSLSRTQFSHLNAYVSAFIDGRVQLQQIMLHSHYKSIYMRFA